MSAAEANFDEDDEEEPGQTVNTLATDTAAANILEAAEEEPPVVEEPPEEILPEDEPVYVTSREHKEKEQSILMLLREHRAYYECSMGRKVRLLAPDAPVPEVPSADGVTWDVWEFNSEDEAFSKEATRLGLVTGPPIRLEHGWDITNQKHQTAIFQLLQKHTPKLVVMASASRPVSYTHLTLPTKA